MTPKWCCWGQGGLQQCWQGPPRAALGCQLWLQCRQHPAGKVSTVLQHFRHVRCRRLARHFWIICGVAMTAACKWPSKASPRLQQQEHICHGSAVETEESFHLAGTFTALHVRMTIAAQLLGFQHIQTAQCGAEGPYPPPQADRHGLRAWAMRAAFWMPQASWTTLAQPSCVCWGLQMRAHLQEDGTLHVGRLPVFRNVAAAKGHEHA